MLNIVQRWRSWCLYRWCGGGGSIPEYPFLRYFQFPTKFPFSKVIVTFSVTDSAAISAIKLYPVEENKIKYWLKGRDTEDVDSHIWKDAVSVQYFKCFKHIPQVCFVMTERLCLSVGRGALSRRNLCRSFWCVQIISARPPFSWSKVLASSRPDKSRFKSFSALCTMQLT